MPTSRILTGLPVSDDNSILKCLKILRGKNKNLSNFWSPAKRNSVKFVKFVDFYHSCFSSILACGEVSASLNTHLTDILFVSQC